MELKKIFVHHVYFWLHNPDSKEDLDKLTKGLQKLTSAKSVNIFHIGRPADTNRDVIVRDYALSWLLIFNNKDDQEAYQADPVHHKFIEECQHLWSKVVVYDAIDVNS